VTEGKLSKQVKTLKEQLKEMPTNMRVFSLCLRSLYVENAVGSTEEPAVEFRKLRDDTRNDAMVYLKGLLPLSTVFVRSIIKFFEYFEYLTLDEWKESLNDILDDTVAYKELCTMVVQAHEDILVPLKERQNEATILTAEFENLNKKLADEIKELDKDIKQSKGWAMGLMFIPIVGAIARPLLMNHISDKMTRMVAGETQSEINVHAAQAVRTALIPAISNFIEGLTGAAGFFSVIKEDLQIFKERGEDATSENMKKIHFKIMNGEAKEMKALCKEFFAVLPAVRTDFEAIPTEGTDQNYVDRWLAKQKDDMKKRCSVKRILKEALKAIAEQGSE
jgi:hypothetical protein